MGNPFSHTIGNRGGGAIVATRPLMTELAVERVLDKRYKIVEPIGAGGSSQVYLAQDLALKREVAIKVLDPQSAANGETRRMFTKEARSLASLSHPSIVAVYDVGEVDGTPFIVMENLPGGSLKQRLERTGPLSPADAVRYTVDIANGLAFAHSKGIIHADLKPSNVLFDANDHAKVVDFGIARTPQEDADTPQLFATAMYVAPERVEGKAASQTSDVYGLGLVLYEMLVGKPPFSSTNAAVLLRDHVVRMPVPPSHLRPSLVKELDSIVLKALAKEPRLRYQKATEMAQALVSIENLDKELATTRFRSQVMTEPIRDMVPEVEQSPVVALFSSFGQPIRSAFYSGCIALPMFALGLAAGFDSVPLALAAGFVLLAGIGGQLAFAVAIAWAVETITLFLFVPSFAVLFAILGVWLWVREVKPEQTALAMAMPVAAPLGLAPAFLLTAAAVEGLMGVATAAWGAVMTVMVAIAMGKQTFGAYVETGFVLEQTSLFDPARAAATKAAIANILLAPNDRMGPLLTVLDPAGLWTQLSGFVSRVVGADVTAIATVIAWTIAALAVWASTRVLRTFFDTLLNRPNRWFALYVFAQTGAIAAGAMLLFMIFISWGPLANAPARPAQNVLLLSSFVGAILATAAAVVISSTSPREPVEEVGSTAVAARRK
jgi:tRNA A-37 threonylcarbamoyl transferase component Bud32